MFLWFLLLGCLVVLVLGIVAINFFVLRKSSSRDHFLKAFVRFVDGNIEPIADKDDSCRITFVFESQRFLYEEVRMEGFEQPVYRVYLKAPTETPFTLDFTERTKGSLIRSDVKLASDITDDKFVGVAPRILMPSVFDGLSAFSNFPGVANDLFMDKEFVGICAEYKNTDGRGYPFMGLRVLDGDVTVEFYSSSSFYPSLSSLRSDIPSLEDHLEPMLLVVKKIRKLFNK